MTATPVTRYAKGELRKKEILAATVDLIYDHGISGVTHRAVAKRANVAPSAPSYFFPSIDDLVVEAFRSIMTTMFGDLDKLRKRVTDEDMQREVAVDAYISLLRSAAPKYDKLQFEAYIFAESRPALRDAVDTAIGMTHRPGSTLVTVSRRPELGWAAPIFAALADGFGLYRVASPHTANFEGLREGLLALMEALPGRPVTADDVRDDGPAEPAKKAPAKKAPAKKAPAKKTIR